MHSPDGRHFLGLRMRGQGSYEIVYEATVTRRRLILKIGQHNIDHGIMAQHLEKALGTGAVLEALCSSLRSANIGYAIEFEKFSQQKKL